MSVPQRLTLVRGHGTPATSVQHGTMGKNRTRRQRNAERDGRAHQRHVAIVDPAQVELAGSEAEVRCRSQRHHQVGHACMYRSVLRVKVPGLGVGLCVGLAKPNRNLRLPILAGAQDSMPRPHNC